MKIADLLEEDFILPDLKASNKMEAIQEMVEVLFEIGKIRDKKKLVEALAERERLGTTGIGDNIAIPHAKSKETEKIIAMFGRSVNGLEFDSLDRKLVHYIFLLIAPLNSAGTHLKALARISRLLKNDSFRKSLLKAENTNQIFNIILKEDDKYID